jgi:hypothetical protein
MRNLKRILLASVALLAWLVYVWVAAVRAVPAIRRRKEEWRDTEGWRRSAAG